MSSSHAHPELLKLLEAVCEDRVSREQHARLEELLRDDPSARRCYREYVNLHGLLYWDTAIGSEEIKTPPQPTTRHKPNNSIPARRYRLTWTVGALSLIVGIAAIILTGDPSSKTPDGNLVVENSSGESAAPQAPSQDEIDTPVKHTRQAVTVEAVTQRNLNAQPQQNPVQIPETPTPEAPTFAGSADETIVAFIDGELAYDWKLADIQPSPRATDAEWYRRVSLDLIGQIPSVEEAEKFLSSQDPLKRDQVIEDLLQRPEFITNWSTIWANLMVGRTPDRAEYRYALTKFLRDSFRENRPWDEMVASFISAEGTTEENQASGFLLAHVNNQAVPATAIAARLFLGTNVQCTQCHDHPFNDAKQNQFWELNSFFKQTARVVERNHDPETGVMTQTVSLVTHPETNGPTIFENRRGEIKPAFPIYNGIKVDEGAGTNRRRELAKLLSAGDKPQIAEAYVNRLWKHFFGYGFTNPVDDMGRTIQPRILNSSTGSLENSSPRVTITSH